MNSLFIFAIEQSGLEVFLNFVPIFEATVAAFDFVEFDVVNVPEKLIVAFDCVDESALLQVYDVCRIFQVSCNFIKLNICLKLFE